MSTPAERQAEANAQLEHFARLLWVCSEPSRNPEITARAWELFSPDQRRYYRTWALRLIEQGVRPPDLDQGDQPLSGQLEMP